MLKRGWEPGCESERESARDADWSWWSHLNQQQVLASDRLNQPSPQQSHTNTHNLHFPVTAVWLLSNPVLWFNGCYVVPPSLALSLSVFLSLSLCHSFSLSVSLSLYISLSLFLSGIHSLFKFKLKSFVCIVSYKKGWISVQLVIFPAGLDLKWIDLPSECKAHEHLMCKVMGVIRT